MTYSSVIEDEKTVLRPRSEILDLVKPGERSAVQSVWLLSFERIIGRTVRLVLTP